MWHKKLRCWKKNQCFFGEQLNVGLHSTKYYPPDAELEFSVSPQSLEIPPHQASSFAVIFNPVGTEDIIHDGD